PVRAFDAAGGAFLCARFGIRLLAGLFDCLTVFFVSPVSPPRRDHLIPNYLRGRGQRPALHLACIHKDVLRHPAYLWIEVFLQCEQAVSEPLETLPTARTGAEAMNGAHDRLRVGRL